MTMIKCSSCRLDLSLDGTRYCERCYARAVSSNELLKQDIKELSREAMKMAAELKEIKQELAAIKQGSLF